MTDISVPIEAPVTVEWAKTGRLRSHTGYIVTLGLIVKIVIDSSALYSSWLSSPVRNLIIGAIVTAPFIIAAIVLTPSTPGRKTAAILLFSAAAVATVMSGSPEFWDSRQTLHGVLWLAAGLLGLTGWLVLTRRPAATFLLLIPLAIFAYAWEVNHWVHWHESAWLHDLGAPWPSGSSGSITAILYGFWAALDEVFAVALAAAAGLIERASAPRSANAARFESAYASGTDAGNSRPAAGAPAMAQSAHVPTNGTAIASLVCGIAGMFLFFPAAIPAVICGHVARGRIRRTGQNGAGLALAGLILGYIGLVILAAVVIGLTALVVAAGHSSS